MIGSALDCGAVASGKKRSVLDAVEMSTIIVLVVLGMYYLNVALGGRLNVFGILPRSLWGLMGIVFSPLLHYSEPHVTTNCVSFFLLLIILYMHREYRPEVTLTAIWILSGLGTWLIGRAGYEHQPMVHIGASGVIYGLVTYLIAAAWWLRSWTSALWASVILFLYGGIFYGLLPREGIMSWEGHLSGAVAGVIVARKQHK